MTALLAYLKNLLIAFDQLLGALVFGMEADMTISAYCWLWHIRKKRHWPHRLVDALFFWDREEEKRHCELSWESELERKQVAEECRPAEKHRDPPEN